MRTPFRHIKEIKSVINLIKERVWSMLLFPSSLKRIFQPTIRAIFQQIRNFWSCISRQIFYRFLAFFRTYRRFSPIQIERLGERGFFFEKYASKPYAFPWSTFPSIGVSSQVGDSPIYRKTGSCIGNPSSVFRLPAERIKEQNSKFLAFP